MLKRLVDGVLHPVLAPPSAEEEEEEEEEEEDDDDDDGDEEGKGVVLPRPLWQLSERLFALASDKAATLDRNRPLLYALQSRVSRLAQQEQPKGAPRPRPSRRRPRERSARRRRPRRSLWSGKAAAEGGGRGGGG